jgi:hypothetical protein
MRLASTPSRWFSWLPLRRNWCCTSFHVPCACSNASSSPCWQWGPILNVRFGLRPSHYGVSLLTAVAGAAFAARQILLHVMPGDPGYGSALLGYHYYTWAFIGFAVAIIALAIMLLFDNQFRDDGKPQPVGALAGTAVGLVIALTALNVISTLLECGFGACPDNPVAYELLKRGP